MCVNNLPWILTSGMHNFFEAKGRKLDRGQRTSSPPAARGLESAVIKWGSLQMHFGVGLFWARKSHLVATFSIIYFSWKSGNGTLWWILKYAYTSGVPNNWKPVNHRKYLTLEWTEIEAAISLEKNVHLKKTSNGPIFKSTVASHAGQRHGFCGIALHECGQLGIKSMTSWSRVWLYYNTTPYDAVDICR